MEEDGENRRGVSDRNDICADLVAGLRQIGSFFLAEEERVHEGWEKDDKCSRKQGERVQQRQTESEGNDEEERDSGSERCGGDFEDGEMYAEVEREAIHRHGGSDVCNELRLENGGCGAGGDEAGAEGVRKGGLGSEGAGGTRGSEGEEAGGECVEADGGDEECPGRRASRVRRRMDEEGGQREEGEGEPECCCGCRRGDEVGEEYYYSGGGCGRDRKGEGEEVECRDAVAARGCRHGAGKVSAGRRVAHAHERADAGVGYWRWLWRRRYRRGGGNDGRLPSSSTCGDFAEPRLWGSKRRRVGEAGEPEDVPPSRRDSR